MRLLPFNFEPISVDTVFISNTGGFSESLSRESLTELIFKGSSSDDDLNQRLLSKLFIADTTSYATAELALASSTSKKLTSELHFNPIFMIVPTLRCDHTCSYCQVSRANEDARGFDLDVALIPKIISQIKALGRPPYKIELQGGEPLLCFDTIEKIYFNAERILGDDSFELVIATTLSLLNDDILAWAKCRNVHFSTSLDGTEIVHNKNRILSTNDSYLRLKKGIELVQTTTGKDRVSTVTTVTGELLKAPEDILQAHCDLGLPNLFVRPISPYGFAKKDQDSEYSIAQYMTFYERLFDAILELWKSGKSVIEHSAATHIKRVFNPGFNSYADLKSPSGVLLNSFLFNYDGRIYGSDELRMLQRIYKDQDFSLGHIEAPEVTKTLYSQIISNSFNQVLPGCNTCAYQPFCGADPCNEISLQGEYIGDKTRSRFCSYHKEMFTFLLNRWFRCSESQSMLKEWLYA